MGMRYLTQMFFFIPLFSTTCEYNQEKCSLGQGDGTVTEVFPMPCLGHEFVSPVPMRKERL